MPNAEKTRQPKHASQRCLCKNTVHTGRMMITMLTSTTQQRFGVKGRSNLSVQDTTGSAASNLEDVEVDIEGRHLVA